MQSKRSFFNKTVFRKNLTRFAPVMVVYTLCLLMGIMVMYMESAASYRTGPNIWFAHYMCQCIQVMGVVNLFYAPLLAMLLFGDLYNSRMCNALHALPPRRETWFVTNLLSGLAFSVLPTAVMTVLSIPLLNGTVVHNAWQIAALWFAGANLEFLCYFGIAVFAAMCTGSRFAMGAVYAALNGGAFVIYMLIDTIYTPMLYGVITPDRLCLLLTPIANMADDIFAEVQSANELARLFNGRESEMVANFWVDENFYNLIAYAVAGLVFMVIALLLYRKRNLECAGDAVAFRVLEPVFQLAAAVCGASMGVLCMDMFFSSVYRNNVALVYIFLLCGMIVGWFAGKMLIERTIRVFRLKNWRGLAALAAVAVVTLGMTWFDVFGIEEWTPKAEKVKSVSFGQNDAYTVEITEREDIEQIIRLQEMALEDRLENYTSFPLSYIQSLPNGVADAVYPTGEGFYYGEGGYDPYEEHLHSAPISITYHMESGKDVQRSYYIWSSLEEGDIAKEFLSDYDLVWQYARMGWYDEFDLDQVFEIRVGGEEFPEELVNTQTAQSLLDAIRADCEAGNMAQNYYFHHGYFQMDDEAYEEYSKTRDSSRKTRQIDVRIYTGEENDYTSVDFDIYADAGNTLNWLREHGLLAYETVEQTGYLAYKK